MSKQITKSVALTLEEVQMEFLCDWEAGNAPTLDDFARRYPEFADELTEFVLEFIAIENAAQRLTESPEISDEMKQEMDDFLASVQKPVSNLREAHEAMGWNRAQFERKVGISKRNLIRISQGEISDAPKQKHLVGQLSAALCRPEYQICALLQTPSYSSPEHFKATGTPQKLVSSSMTWREALLDCQRRGELPAEDLEIWLREAEKEGDDA